MTIHRSPGRQVAGSETEIIQFFPANHNEMDLPKAVFHSCRTISTHTCNMIYVLVRIVQGTPGNGRGRRICRWVS